MSNFYPYKDTLEVKQITGEKVVFEIEGNVATQYNGQMTDSNGTIRFEVSREKAEKIAQEILDD